jgi:hypothetical protein
VWSGLGSFLKAATRPRTVSSASQPPLRPLRPLSPRHALVICHRVLRDVLGKCRTHGTVLGVFFLLGSGLLHIVLTAREHAAGVKPPGQG